MTNDIVYLKMFRLTLIFELIWWVVTALILGAVLYPILSQVPDYPFLYANSGFVVVFITLARFIFLTKYTFLNDREFLKIALTFLCVPLIFLLVNELNYFQTFVDETGLTDWLKDLPGNNQTALREYIKTEMLFFGTASIITAVAFPLRMIVSIWQKRNN